MGPEQTIAKFFFFFFQWRCSSYRPPQFNPGISIQFLSFPNSSIHNFPTKLIHYPSTTFLVFPLAVFLLVGSYNYTLFLGASVSQHSQFIRCPLESLQLYMIRELGSLYNAQGQYPTKHLLLTDVQHVATFSVKYQLSDL